MDRKIYGEESPKVYDDWDGIREVTSSLPDHAPHRKVDKIILAGVSSDVKTAIVCPPTIYGRSRSPGNQRGHQIYELARNTLEKKHGIQVGAGQARWTNVHVFDLSDCYMKLVEAAAQGGGKATWGADGYYFTENGEHVWGDVASVVAAEAKKQGYLETDEVVEVLAEEADKLSPAGSILWGANSRCKALRARNLLGWMPKEQSMDAETPEVVSSEAKRLKLLGVLEGHAAKVAG